MKLKTVMVLSAAAAAGATAWLCVHDQWPVAVFSAFATGGMVSNIVLKNMVDSTFGALEEINGAYRRLLLENENLKTRLGDRR